jgi:hypothetical protein
VGLAVFARCLTRLFVLAVGVRRVYEGTVGVAKGWGLLRGSGGHVAKFPKVRWSGARALFAGRVQTECVGAMGGVRSFSVEHRWLGCKCCEEGTVLASGGASGNEPVSTGTTPLRRSRMDFASRSPGCSCRCQPSVAPRRLAKR